MGSKTSLKVLLVGVILIVIALLLHRYGRGGNEHFGTGTESILDYVSSQWVADNPLNLPQSIPLENIHSIPVTRWPEVLDAAPSLPLDIARSSVSASKSDKNTTLLMVDPQDAATHYSSKPQILAPKGYFVTLTSITTGLVMDCGYQWVGKTIGYTDRSSLLFILSVLHGHRISPKAVRLVNVPSMYWRNMGKLLEGPLQLIVTYVVPSSPYMKLLALQDINLMGFQRIQEERLQLSMPSVSVETVNLMAMVEGGRARVLAKERMTHLPALQQVAVMVNGTPSTSDTNEAFRNQGPAEWPLRDEESPTATGESRAKQAVDIDKYECYGDETIKTPTACESPYDASGLRKRYQTVWDKKCESNEECPYFTGERGGCDKDTGLCELPVGTNRLSYRKADTIPPFQPFCYNTPAWDLSGCKAVSKPKWAFISDKGYIDLRAEANSILSDAAKK